MDERRKKIVVGLALIIALLAFYFLAENASPNYFRDLGIVLPLPVFTFIIALIDGFNPCTMWVLTFLLVLLISASGSRKRIFAVGYTFVVVVYLFYFFFMALWLNVFKYIGFIDPIRISIGLVALIAGAINCKEFFAFRKGVTLMIQDRSKAPLERRIEGMKEVIKTGSMPALVAASVVLAAFASLVELPCTAGWPIIYTSILSSKVFANSSIYYLYLMFYNLIYIIPLAAIITAFGYLLKGRQISEEQMKIIKLVGGVVMVALGMILLFNPDLLMLV